MNLSDGILGGSDNLYKYLFTAGLLMVITAIVYPLQKQQELELEINNNNKQAAILTEELKWLSDEVNGLEQEAILTKKILDSLDRARTKARNPTNISIQIDNLKFNYNKHLDSAKRALNNARIKNLTLEFNTSRITILKQHKDEYEDYFVWILWPGIIIALVGFFLWSYSTAKHEGLFNAGLFSRKKKKP